MLNYVIGNLISGAVLHASIPLFTLYIIFIAIGGAGAASMLLLRYVWWW